MNPTTKLLATGAAVAALLATGTYAIAQQGPGFGPGMGMGMMHGKGPGMMRGPGHGPMMGPMGGRMGGAFADPATRLEAIKAEIGIKPEQAAAWETYAKVVKDTAAEQRKHFEQIDRDAVRAMQPSEREKHFAAMQTQRQAAQQIVRSATEALLATLDDAQKAKAQQVLPGIASIGPGPAMGHGVRHGMGPGMGFGMGPRFQR
jgi:periplasmic protein CpxP/Spy